MAKLKGSAARGWADPGDPGTWRRYRKGLCGSCRAGCCSLVVEVTAEDLIRLGLASGWEVENAIKGLIRSLKREGIIRRYNFRTERFVLEQTGAGDCRFLDEERRCSVYEDRPSVCRAHPLELSPRAGFCPYVPK